MGATSLRSTIGSGAPEAARPGPTGSSGGALDPPAESPYNVPATSLTHFFSFEPLLFSLRTVCDISPLLCRHHIPRTRQECHLLTAHSGRTSRYRPLMVLVLAHPGPVCWLHSQLAWRMIAHLPSSHYSGLLFSAPQSVCVKACLSASQCHMTHGGTSEINRLRLRMPPLRQPLVPPASPGQMFFSGIRFPFRHSPFRHKFCGVRPRMPRNLARTRPTRGA
ncbi:hypothetical protein EDB89DRAFT_1366309 [Lactarius sanguifluus]|nr:hypothetical protein EDB89DRAFT_1366309 [Lactarius sanguifluus]